MNTVQVKVKKILLVSGFAGSGKDYFSDHLVKTRNYTKFSFAHQLKKTCAKKYSVDIKKFNCQESKKEMFLGEPLRNILTKEALFIKEKDPDFFVKSVAKEIEKHIAKNLGEGLFVISDHRFLNEYHYLRNIYGPGVVKTMRVKRDTVKSLDCQAEHQLDKCLFDYYVDNNSDLENINKAALCF